MTDREVGADDAVVRQVLRAVNGTCSWPRACQLFSGSASPPFRSPSVGLSRYSGFQV